MLHYHQSVNDMKNRFIHLGCGCILLMMFLIGGVSALSVSITPDRIDEGDTVTIDIRDLVNGSTFALTMGSTVGLDNQTDFAFRATNVKMPFSLTEANVRVRAEPATSAGILAAHGGTTQSMTQYGEGVIEFPKSIGTVSSGSIDELKVFGTAVAGSQSVDLSLELNGKKQGPDSSVITFGLAGVTQGSAWVYVFVDGAEVCGKQIIVGEPPATATPTPTPTQSSGSSSPGSSGSTTSPQPTATVAESNTREVSSLDGIAWITFLRTGVTGATSEQVLLTKVAPQKVPEAWVALEGAYAVSPAGAAFGPGATLLVTVNETVNAHIDSYRPFLASYANNAWTIVPSRIEGNGVIADISAAGQYALMAFRADIPAASTTVPETPAQTQQQESPSPTSTSPQKSGTEAAFLITLAGAGVALFLFIRIHRR